MSDRIRGMRLYGVNTQGPQGRLIAGVVVLGLGILWTLDNLGLTDAGRVLAWWPVLLVGYGVVKLLGLGTRRAPLLGSLALVFGVVLLLGKFGYVHAGVGLVFPLLLILMGVNLVRRAMRGPQPIDSTSDVAEGAHVTAFAMMGATTRRAYSQALVSADVTAVMAGTELDLRAARPAGDSVIVDVFAMWGGIQIYVAEGWRVLVETTPIMGGVEDDTLPPSTDGPVPTVIIRGLVVMGGVEVSHQPDEDKKGRVRVGVITSRRDADGTKQVDIAGPAFRIRVEKGVIPTDPSPVGPEPSAPPSTPDKPATPDSPATPH